MKFNFKKIGSILASGIMLASTLGFAAAASYPEPFVSSGTEDSAVVVGANAATTDWAAAIDVQTKLNALVTTSAGVSTAAGGDSFKIEKASTKFQLSRGILDVYAVDITEDKLPILLTDGKFIDNDNDEFDYTQKIEMANSTLTMFDDNDYKEDTPTIGMKISNGVNILNYTIDFSDEPTFNDLSTTTMPLMGKEYYVLTVLTTNVSLTLLDSAVDTLLAEGETTTLTVEGKSYDCSVSFVSSASEVKLLINGETTNALQASETQKLSDGSYVGVKEVLYTGKDTGTSKVEFSIGSGKLKLTNDSDIEMNEDTISDLKAFINWGADNDHLGSIMLQWNADDDKFAAPDSEILMPGFETVKISFGGMVWPAEEEIKIESDGKNSIQLKDFPLKTSTEDINILYTNTSGYYIGVGKDSDSILRTPGGVISQMAAALDENGTFENITFDGDTDEYFVASWNDTTSSESYLMKATSFKVEGGIEKVNIQYKKNSVWTDIKSEAKNGTSFTLGNVEITVGHIDKTTKQVVLDPQDGVTFSNLYSKEGMKILLPWVNVTQIAGTANVTTAAHCNANLTEEISIEPGQGYLGTYLNLTNSTAGAGTPIPQSVACTQYNESYTLVMWEEDKNENVAKGTNINVTCSETSSTSEVQLSAITNQRGGTAAEIGDTDVHRNFVYSALATEELHDQGPDRYAVKLIYHGDESYGEIFISSPETTITPGTSSVGGQVVVVKDSEVSSVSSKNLFVVGGSCINTVAAKILGSTTPICTTAFTEKTGVGAGQYIIKTVESPYNSDKIAMLVAGYEAADTVNAVAKAVEGVTSDKDTSQVYPIVST